MSGIDADLRSLLLNLVLFPIIVILLTWYLFKKPLVNLYKRLYARIVGGDRFIGRLNTKVGHEKENLFGPLRALKGDNRDLILLEVGAGGGANFEYYPKGTNIVCVDPNPNFQSYLKKNVAKFPHVKIKQWIVAKGEDMSDIPDGICDAVVCTFVICSVEDVDGFVKEAKRVLKPGGMFFYMEHVASRPNTWSYTIQSLANPVWRLFTDGCNLNRQTWTNIEQAGFSQVEYRRFSTNSWTPMRYLLSGTATK